MRTDASLYPIWQSEIITMVEDKFEYKYIKVNGLKIEWEEGPNRVLELKNNSEVKIKDSVFG